MKPGIEKLLKFIQQKECRPYLDMAHETFFMEFCEENKVETFSQIKELLGDVAWNQVYPCALEFFFSNAYLRGNQRWNVIELFLKKQGASLKAEEQEYLHSLGQSHMSLYEIIDIRPEEGLTLRDLLEDKDPIQVDEKSLTRQVNLKQILGARICSENNHLVIAGGCLLIDRSVSRKLIRNVRQLHMAGMQLLHADMLGEHPSFTQQENERLFRVMWAPEIALAYMKHVVEKPDVKKVKTQTTSTRKRTTSRQKKDERKGFWVFEGSPPETA